MYMYMYCLHINRGGEDHDELGEEKMNRKIEV